MGRVLNEKVTINTYVDSGIIEFVDYEFLTFRIRNTGTPNSLKFKIFAGHDINNVTYELKAETTLTAGADSVDTLKDKWRFFKYSIKSAVADSPTTVSSWIDDGQPIP